MKNIKIVYFIFAMQLGTSLPGLPKFSFSHALEFSVLHCWLVIWFTRKLGSEEL